MLTSLYEALALHLAALDMPVYLADCVPEGALFPYVTAEVEAPITPTEEGRLTLTLWCLGGTANADRLRLSDSILALLPAFGLRMQTAAGIASLRMKGCAECLHSKSALGLRMSWTLRFYPAA